MAYWKVVQIAYVRYRKLCQFVGRGLDAACDGWWYAQRCLLQAHDLCGHVAQRGTAKGEVRHL